MKLTEKIKSRLVEVIGYKDATLIKEIKGVLKKHLPKAKVSVDDNLWNITQSVGSFSRGEYTSIGGEKTMGVQLADKEYKKFKVNAENALIEIEAIADLEDKDIGRNNLETASLFFVLAGKK